MSAKRHTWDTLQAVCSAFAADIPAYRDRIGGITGVACNEARYGNDPDLRWAAGDDSVDEGLIWLPGFNAEAA